MDRRDDSWFDGWLRRFTSDPGSRRGLMRYLTAGGAAAALSGLGAGTNAKKKKCGKGKHKCPKNYPKRCCKDGKECCLSRLACCTPV